jgi:transcriptional regulator with XRE-family HTH domain/KaiC/GvpD/RAD55 family RecA-like ATPase
MSGNQPSPIRVASGIDQLDRILGGLLVGDNVLWYDDTGSLVWPYCVNLIQSSQAQNKPVIYVSFDRSPRNVLEKLGLLAEYPALTILDCFTWGKGEGSEVFLRFYYETRPEWPCRIVRVDDPKQVSQVMDVIYGLISDSNEDVRLVFESITGMQELWGGEEQFLNFYAHSCPRLYELNTVAYWVVVKEAHSSKLRARINQVAQVAIELSIKRGTTFLSILKAERRGTDNLHKPFKYWTKESAITFEDETGTSGKLEFGQKLKEIRIKRGFSQGELAKLVGVTPSTISQVESNLIYPSLPALVKIAEVLSVDISSFFQTESTVRKIVFSPADSLPIKLADIPSDIVSAHILTPVGVDAKAVLYLLEIRPGQKLSRHFFPHKGEEVGYLLSGRLQITVSNAVHKLKSGDAAHLSSESPSQWMNPGPGIARLLWMPMGQ